MKTLETIIKQEIYGYNEDNNEDNNEEAFYVFNVEDLLLKHKMWSEYLSRVSPFYAVKCNDLQLVVEILSGLGLGFDCSSQSEVESVIRCGTQVDRIIFANVCKYNAQLRYIKSVGIDLMTFDNEYELSKISQHFPRARLVLRIKSEDSHSTSKLNLKFGAEVSEFESLLKRAKSLDLNVVGVSFHVGSGGKTTDPYLDAIKKARIGFNIGIELGFKMDLLDIGGGFPGSQRTELSFETISSAVNEALDEYFPVNENKLTIIAEPGRLYAMSAFDLYAMITSKRILFNGNEKICMYYLNDGLYGSFCCVKKENRIVEPIPVLRDNSELESRQCFSTVLWGPTCDFYDCIRKGFRMPEMNVGEWLLFKDMGHYSLSTSSTFNGMPLPKMKLLISDYAISVLTKMKNWSQIEKLMNEYENSNLSTIKAKSVYYQISNK